jgi:glycosyltransferase involved in cell wall biosynthesis
MRIAVYTDYVYRRVDGVVHAERAFALFLAALEPHVERLVLIGRLAPDGDARYALPADIELIALPYYENLANNPVAVVSSLLRSLQTMWRALDDVDLVWVLGPYPHAIALVFVAMARRRPVVLGVRQDWPRYVRVRRPGRRWLHVAADVLETIWRGLARRFPVVAVGPELSAHYAHSPAVLDLTISLVPAASVAPSAPPRGYDAELRVLSVGRLDEEKNPLLLADVLALLSARGGQWRLLVCGEGDLSTALAARFAELGVTYEADLLGYVPIGEALFELYRSSHALLHVSWTEGFPQVLIEAFASGLPVVATAVGGVATGVGDAALLVPPGNAEAAADALRRITSEPELRERLIEAGLDRARQLTIEAQSGRLARFLEAQAIRPARAVRAAS